MSTVKTKKVQLGTDATASNNFTLYQPATPDGTLRVGVGNADSPTEVGRFTSAGYKNSNPNVVIARRNGDQTGVSSATWTKVEFNYEIADTNNTFDSTTNYRFTPNVAGYYLVTATVSFYTTATASQVICALYQNGSQISQLSNQYSSGTTFPAPSGSRLVYCNGTTDYLEIYGYQNSGATSQFNNTNTLVSFSLIQQA